MGKSTAESYVKMLTPILLDAEEYLKVLPKSIIESPKELRNLLIIKLFWLMRQSARIIVIKIMSYKKISVESSVITH
jgi:hypothetical protein